MLTKLADIELLLRCPRTGEPLSREGTTLTSRPSGNSYSIAAEVPLLVDFANSVIEPPEDSAGTMASSVRRPAYGVLAKPLKRLMASNKHITQTNVDALMALLIDEIPAPLVLVIGGGSIGQGMEKLYDHPNFRIVSFDIYSSGHVQFVADAHAIPLAEATFDCVIVQAVLEHVLEPERVAGEIWRVLKHRGLVYAETPFLQHVHEAAYDFTRFTHSGHRYLFRRFDCLRTGVCGGAGVQLLWSIDYFFRALFRSRAAGKLFKLAFSWVQLADRLIPENFASDAASGSFFLGRKAVDSIGPKDIVKFYRGAERNLTNG